MTDNHCGGGLGRGHFAHLVPGASAMHVPPCGLNLMALILLLAHARTGGPRT